MKRYIKRLPHIHLGTALSVQIKCRLWMKYRNGSRIIDRKPEHGLLVIYGSKIYITSSDIQIRIISLLDHLIIAAVCFEIPRRHRLHQSRTAHAALHGSVGANLRHLSGIREPARHSRLFNRRMLYRRDALSRPLPYQCQRLCLHVAR